MSPDARFWPTKAASIHHSWCSLKSAQPRATCSQVIYHFTPPRLYLCLPVERCSHLDLPALILLSYLVLNAPCTALPFSVVIPQWKMRCSFRFSPVQVENGAGLKCVSCPVILLLLPAFFTHAQVALTAAQLSSTISASGRVCVSSMNPPRKSE